jgi:hypothetical protein
MCRAPLSADGIQPSHFVRARVATLRVHCRLCRSQLRYPEFASHIQSPVLHFQHLCDKTRAMQVELTETQQLLAEQGVRVGAMGHFSSSLLVLMVLLVLLA